MVQFFKTILISLFKKRAQNIIQFLKDISQVFSKNPDEVHLCSKVFNDLSLKGKMIDVGAHFGGSLRPFAIKGWEIYAFEPDMNNIFELKRSFGDYKKIHIDNRAVSSKEKSNLPFFTSNISSGISGLSKFHKSHKSKYLVDSTTIKAFCSQNNICEIDFLKVDTEGYDLFVLKGIPWESFKPRVIVCEFENKKTVPLDYNAYDMAEYLAKKEYKIIFSEWFPIDEYGKRHKWRKSYKYPSKLIDENGFGNLIATVDKNFYNALLSRANLQ